MSGQLRKLKNRIRSIENTKKITHAMELVAGAKLQRFQDIADKHDPYAEGLKSLIVRALSQRRHQPPVPCPILEHPLSKKRSEQKILIAVITSDTGLCGSYNMDLVTLALERLKTLASPRLVVVGKVGARMLTQKGYPPQETFVGMLSSRMEEILHEFTHALERIFLEENVGAVEILSCRMLKRAAYEARFSRILPFDFPEGEKNSQERLIVEPSPEEVFHELLMAYFYALVRKIFLEALVAEQLARMRAMHQATENAEELKEQLVLARNKARQAAITKEIIEIVTGAQALKGRRL